MPKMSSGGCSLNFVFKHVSTGSTVNSSDAWIHIKLFHPTVTIILFLGGLLGFRLNEQIVLRRYLSGSQLCPWHFSNVLLWSNIKALQQSKSNTHTLCSPSVFEMISTVRLFLLLGGARTNSISLPSMFPIQCIIARVLAIIHAYCCLSSREMSKSPIWSA